MRSAPYFLLSEKAKIDLLVRQASLIEQLSARVEALEARLAHPKKTSRNSHRPPSDDDKGTSTGGSGVEAVRVKKPRPSRPGFGRVLTAEPDHTLICSATQCQHCAADVSGVRQGLRQRYDHIDLPPVRPIITRIALYGGRCPNCCRRFRAEAPAHMPPGTPFGPAVAARVLYLHNTHHVSFERLSGMMSEMFGLSISQGALANILRRSGAKLASACAALKQRLLRAPVIASDETTTRINGKTHWQWVFSSNDTVLHQIAPRRSRDVALGFLGDVRPEVWVSDRYAGQQELATAHQVCLAHVLRDVQYAIDCGDAVFAPKLRDLLRWTIRIGRRRSSLKDSTLAYYLAKAERTLTRLVGLKITHPQGLALQAMAKAWRGKFFIFLQNRDVPATNNRSEQEIRPSVVFRKVTNGFRSTWGADIHAGYRSITGTARLAKKSALQAITEIINGQTARS